MCTTMIITKGATIDGSMIVAHSDDNELADQRIIYVPALNHEAGSMRKIFKESYYFPRLVTDDRGEGYNTEPVKTEPIGYIPQVEHTYAYIDGVYGIMNEHNLMIGECTCGAKYQPVYVTEEQAKKENIHIRLFYSQELSKIALERCKKAREAIELMGKLIDEYGLYSTGETLLVADENEAWVFEMCALPLEVYHSAWVARRVPDGYVFVAANQFRIREIDTDNKNDFIFSKLLKPGLKELKWWNEEQGQIDWLKAVSMGEYNHPYYSLRRVWRVFDRVNPDLCLSPWVEDGFTKDYPFAIQGNRKLNIHDIFSLYRDHYEGTQFDLTQGIAAGPYGDPSRFLGAYDNSGDVANKAISGAWERPISVFYQGYTQVTQIRPQAPNVTKGLVWMGMDIAYTTCFVPFSTQVTNMPKAYQTGSGQKYDRYTAWWPFDFVANWARLNYKRMTEVDIKPLQKQIEELEWKLIHEWDEECREMSDEEAIQFITKICHDNSESVLKKWRDLGDMLIAKYSDGFCNLDLNSNKQPLVTDRNIVPAVNIGYSSTWLNHTNYYKGSITYNMCPGKNQ